MNFETRLLVNRSCFGLNIQRAARVTARKFDEAFRPLGINHWQFAMLMALNVPSGLIISELAHLLVVDRTTITANLKPLERAGFLTIRVDEDNIRSKRIQLTQKGLDVLDAALPIWADVNSEIAGAVGEQASETLLSGLAVVTNA
ncbi:MarR family transcriptional regulator [Rhizobium calliandrae]|uniref:MarR family transcriptional regulator n=1 Tax=Rhizobium calliandrae TaxID=1312182 RepID=A0ABT7KC75_9HYPH|nr:MarR family transcriptional regulator [Rhizobium calliandrae]MDL2406224.1 MarR family transcriptional regulator [Rhizobium calliandrae]